MNDAVRHDHAVRITLELTDAQIEAPSSVAKARNLSRAALTREAVDTYIDTYIEQYSAAGLEKAFGLWRNRDTDSLTYQRALRDEWGEDGL